MKKSRQLFWSETTGTERLMGLSSVFDTISLPWRHAAFPLFSALLGIVVPRVTPCHVTCVLCCTALPPAHTYPSQHRGPVTKHVAIDIFTIPHLRFELCQRSRTLQSFSLSKHHHLFICICLLTSGHDLLFNVYFAIFVSVKLSICLRAASHSTHSTRICLSLFLTILFASHKNSVFFFYHLSKQLSLTSPAQVNAQVP